MTQPWIEGRFEDSVVLTTVEQAINWARQGSLWPMTFGIACCAIEMMSAGAGRFDLDRFGAGAFRPSPRQADLMIVAGTVTYKMASRIRRLYEQMPEPKYVIAMGGLHGGRRALFRVRLSRRAGRRFGRAGRRVRSRLPAAARGAAGRPDAAAGEDSRAADRAGSPAAWAAGWHGAVPGGQEGRRRVAAAVPRAASCRVDEIRPVFDHQKAEDVGFVRCETPLQCVRNTNEPQLTRPYS